MKVIHSTEHIFLYRRSHPLRASLKQPTAFLLAVSFIFSPMQIAFAKEAAPPEKSPPPKEIPTAPPGETVGKNHKADPDKKPPITLKLPEQSHADPPGLDQGEDDAPPPSKDGELGILSEDSLPFDNSRLSYENRPKLEPDQSTGSLTYSYPLALPPGRKGLTPNLALTYDSSSNKNEYLGLGWSVNIPFIERINRTGVENLYTGNYFFSSFDGELKATSTEMEGMSLMLGGGESAGLLTFIEEPEPPSSTTTIQELLEGKTADERANIKSAEIVKVFPTGEYENETYDLVIDVEGIEQIDGGIQIFARAWKGEEQLGFGADGSVEIERFRIFNPPIMVPDGTKSTTTIHDHSFEVDNFTEDPVEAVRQSLAHTISMVGKEGTTILEGSIGNTTSTFYPNAHPESTSVDGRVGATNQAVSWPTIHDASSQTDDVNDSNSSPGELYALARTRSGGISILCEQRPSSTPPPYPRATP